MLAVAAALICLAAPQLPADAGPRTVRGRLLDGDMKPAAGVPIGLLPYDGDDVATALKKPLAHSQADGVFVVSVPVATTDQWLVVGGGPFATQMESLQHSSADPLDLGTVALANGTTMVGRVRGPDGAAIAGVLVVATDMLPDTKHLHDQCEGQRLPCRTVARSDAHGFFKLPGMMLSAATLRLSRDGYFDEVRQPVATGDPLDLTMTASPTVGGIVLDNDDKPVAGVTAHLGMANGKSDDDGRFSFSQRDRGDTVWANRKVGDDWQRFSGKVKPGEELRLRATDKPAAAEVVRVQARTAAGEPVPQFDAFVSWNPENQLEYRPDALLLAASRSWGQSWHAAAVDGTATLRGERSARDDTAMVFVFAQGFAVARVQADSKIVNGAPVVLTLAPEAVIKGRVVDATTNAAIAGAELIATQRLSDSERGHYQSGFRDVADLLGAPTNTKSGADGCYELHGVPAGKLDLFVFAPGRIAMPSLQLELKAGEVRDAVDWSVSSNVRLDAVLGGPIPTGLDVRLHWSRPNMWSSGWNAEFGGAIPVAADGSFAFPDLHPKPYEVQALLPAPPRGGHRVKQQLAIWNGAQAKPEKLALAPLATVPLKGTVGGPVPWQRLAVAALPLPDLHSSSETLCISGPFTLLGSDRAFHLAAPADTRNLLLFDPVTGIALEWVSFETPPESQPFEGRAERVVLSLLPSSAADARLRCSLAYEPDDEHRPTFTRRGLRPGAPEFTSYTAAFAGDTVTFWLPARTGLITVQPGDPNAIDIAKLTTTEPVQVRIGR